MSCVGAASESDYSGRGSGASFVVTIPAGQASVNVTITPTPDTLVEGPESVVLTVAWGQLRSAHRLRPVTIADDPPVVNIVASGGCLGNGARRRRHSRSNAAAKSDRSADREHAIGGTALNTTDYSISRQAYDSGGPDVGDRDDRALPDALGRATKA